MYPEQANRISDALQKIPGVGPQLAQELADALGAPTQSIRHRGRLDVSGSMAVEPRAFSGDCGDALLKPTPPVDEATSSALVTIRHKPFGLSDRKGEQAAALRVAEGILRGDGPNWLLHHAKIDTTGSVADRYQDALTGRTSTTHYYADGFEVIDAKGRGQRDVPVRVFNHGGLAKMLRTSDVVGYLCDLNGMAYQVTPSPVFRWGKVQADQGGGEVYNNTSGHGSATDPVLVKACDKDGGSVTGGGFSLHVPLVPSRDPAIFTDDVLGYTVDDSDTLVVATECHDDPYGTVKAFAGTSGAIRNGWHLCDGDGGTVDLRATFVMGSDGSDEWGTTGGSHPIRPHRHSSTDPASTTQTWSGSWYESAWKLNDHPSATVSSTTTTPVATATAWVHTAEVLVQPHENITTLTTVCALAVDVTLDIEDAPVNIARHSTTTTLATDAEFSVTATVVVTEAETVEPIHDDHVHGLPGSFDVQAGNGASVVRSGETGTPYPVLGHSGTTHTHTATVTVTTTVTHDHKFGPLTHSTSYHSHEGTASTSITDPGHAHKLDDLEHASTSHYHTADVHVWIDPITHTHTTPVMTHTGSLYHREEDFRPPYMVLAYIQRVS